MRVFLEAVDQSVRESWSQPYALLLQSAFVSADYITHLAGSQFPSFRLNKNSNVTIRLSLSIENIDPDKILGLFRTETHRLVILHKHLNVLYNHLDNMALYCCLA
jgi:hypothetical protein